LFAALKQLQFRGKQRCLKPYAVSRNTQIEICFLASPPVLQPGVTIGTFTRKLSPHLHPDLTQAYAWR